jgi:hypothetical protein
MIYGIGFQQVISQLTPNNLGVVSEFTDSASDLKEHGGRFFVPF